MSSHHHNQHHPDHHSHASHQHGPTHDPTVHSPHRHNHANNPTHHPSLHSPETHSGPGPTTHDKMTTGANNPTTDPTLGTTTASAPEHAGKGGSAATATYTSSDPSTAPHAPSTHKILGDIKGAVHGVTGSLQAATGTVFGQKHMADKGFEKMSEEDARLAAKTGKPPVGTEQRGGTVPQSTPTATPTSTSTSTPGGAAEHGRGLPHERT